LFDRYRTDLSASAAFEDMTRCLGGRPYIE